MRFNADDVSYLSRTHDTGDTAKWTLSFWLKLADIDTSAQTYFSTNLAGNNAAAYIYIQDHQIKYWDGALVFATNALLRDPSAWYNIVVARDSAQSGTAKGKVYINGSEVTSFATDNRATNIGTSYINTNIVHYIGYESANPVGSYLAEMTFIDGAMLTSSSFGETKAGIWIPKSTSGLTYGTNGFRLTFQGTGTSTTSQGTTAQTNIGDDQSGEGYHFWHCENAAMKARNRILAFMVYLNDVTEGGETEFLYQKCRFKPEKNTMLVWPAQFTHVHRGNPPLSNDKYIITG